jgi:predicted phage-related endonuclease
VIEQRSPEWFAQRAGKITASRFIDVVSRTREGKPTSDRARYLRELVFERSAGAAKHEIKSRALTWGTEVEGFAREAYELQTGNVVRPAEFTVHVRYPFIGASADGLVDPDGGIEMKCPHDEGVHIATWLDGMPAEHVPQVQGNMGVHGRSWWDFISYDPRQAPHLRLYVQRIPRDDAYIARLVVELQAFEAEVAAAVERLSRKAA